MKYFKKLFVTMLILLSPTFASAESTTYVEAGAYNISAKRWSKSVETTSSSYDTWIWNLEGKDSLHKNGRRDSILSVPSSSEPEDITLIIWFHGLNGFGKKSFETRMVPQMEDLAREGRSFAVAIPEMPWSQNTSTPRGRQGQVWSKPGSLQRYVGELKEKLNTWSQLRHGRPTHTVRIVFVGHSAGGSAIKSASREGGLCRVNPEHIIWSDASYGSWLSQAWRGCMKGLPQESELHVLVRKWDSPHKNAEKIIKTIERSDAGPRLFYKVLDRRKWTHGAIGNNAILLTDIFPPGC